MPYASEDARDLTGRLLVYESGDRIRAKEVSAALCSDHSPIKLIFR
jgi:endonuclease/exonuclease/phosphatase (EEP) superfamily protein YafD